MSDKSRQPEESETRIDRSAFSIFSSFAEADAADKAHWLSRTPEERARLHKNSDNLSFFSGHATLAFALAVSAGTIASMRHHKLAALMWATGLVLASTGAYLRIAADRHYATDVIMGMVVGTVEVNL